MTIKILGLESSCDDSAASIIDSDLNILSNIVISQHQEHQKFQGVVPEIAARSHLTNIGIALDAALKDADLLLSDIDVISATSGPGLIGGVIVGSMYGKALSSVLKKPFVAINHLEGHALTARLTHNIDFPYLLFLASGGHCQFIAVKDLGQYQILGRTIDDAIGEAFDKVAKMMNLGFPGGPIIEQMAQHGDINRFNFPRPLFYHKNSNMSFSGLKTAVSLQIQKLPNLHHQDICDISASFQKAVCDIITKKTQYAIMQYEKICNNKSLVISGGVASNLAIRASYKKLAQLYGYNFVAPPIKLCTDNAAMIAFAGLERFKSGKIDDMSFNPRARWSLEELS